MRKIRKCYAIYSNFNLKWKLLKRTWISPMLTQFPLLQEAPVTRVWAQVQAMLRFWTLITITPLNYNSNNNRLPLITTIITIIVITGTTLLFVLVKKTRKISRNFAMNLLTTTKSSPRWKRFSLRKFKKCKKESKVWSRSASFSEKKIILWITIMRLFKTKWKLYRKKWRCTKCR